MVAPSAGQIVLVPFPFSDLSQSKVRPAVVVADAGRDDWILCQITSNAYGDPDALPIGDSDFEAGGLQVASWVRPGKLFTCHAGLLIRVMGKLRPTVRDSIRDAILGIIRR